MYVNDLDAAKDFFVSFLGGVSNNGYYESCIVAIEENLIELTV